MKQLTEYLSRRPTVTGVEDELGLIALQRTAVPPPPGSVTPVVRPFVEADRPAVEEMIGRSSTETLRRRFHAPVDVERPRRLAELLVPARRGVHLVAVAGDAVVGVATLQRSGHGAADMAVVVEDAWQAHGVGRCLVAALVRGAGERGVTTIVADVMREPTFVLERLVHALAPASVDSDGPVATVRIPVSLIAADPAPCGCGPVATA